MTMSLFAPLAIDILSSYNFIIEASIILILSFFFGELSRRTNIPSVLMLIILGLLIKFAIEKIGGPPIDFFPILEILGIVGLIMIVLEAALELELRKDKTVPILKALGVALIGLGLSAWVASILLQYFIPQLTTAQAWIYATPLSILSSAIIIPSVSGLAPKKKEFHVYESTFSDIAGIMLFYYLASNDGSSEHSTGVFAYLGNIVLTIVISLIASSVIVIIFQRINSHVKVLLLISVLLLLYSLGTKMHLSSLIIILIFGLLIANMKLFFQGPLQKFLDKEKAHDIYEGLHILTLETAFVVRTFFFVIFGMTIALSSLADVTVALVSLGIIASIYLIRWAILKLFIGADIKPQLYIAPRGLITILLFYAIPQSMVSESFNSGILLFIIIGTSIIMTLALIADKRRTSVKLNEVRSQPVHTVRWKAPSVEE